MELLNINDEEYTYLDCVEDNSLWIQTELDQEMFHIGKMTGQANEPDLQVVGNSF